MLGSHTLYRPSLSLQLARSAGPVARAASTSSSPRPPPHHQSLPTSSSAGPDASSPSPSNSTATSSAHALNTSASAHLFALAAEEELVPPRPPSRQPPSVLNPTEHIWDGDEPLSWTVKRMVSDSHKPIRSGKIRSAEEKIRDEMKQREVVARMTGPIPAKVGQSSTSANSAGEEDDLAAGQVKKNTKVWPGHLVGGDPNHRPWHSEYVVPSHDRALIRRGVLLKPPPSTLATSSAGVKPAELPADPVARAALRRVQKLNAGPVRLSSARESALDYEFGGRGGRSGDVGAEEEVHRPSTGMGKEGEGDGEGGKLLEVRMGAGDESLGAGWGSLVELRLERARAQGQFNNLAGRGKPLEYDSVSPFLSRTEHIMNRVIKRNDALPPWIQMQQEHTASLDHMRKTLVSTLHTLLLLSRSVTYSASVDEIAAVRLREFEPPGGPERATFEGLVTEVNRLVRRSNGVTPGPARRGITSLDAELARAYPLAAEQVYQTLHSPPVPTVSAEELRRQMARQPKGKIFAIVWPKSWGRMWAWLLRLFRIGSSRAKVAKEGD